MSAVRFAQNVVTRKMLDSIKDMLARFVFEDEFLNGHITTEIYQEILAWIYTSHEKNMNMALGALEALEIADGTGHYIYTIISIKKMIALLHETVLTQLIFVEDDNATDESRIIFIVQSDRSSRNTSNTMPTKEDFLFDHYAFPMLARDCY